MSLESYYLRYVVMSLESYYLWYAIVFASEDSSLRVRGHGVVRTYLYLLAWSTILMLYLYGTLLFIINWFCLVCQVWCHIIWYTILVHWHYSYNNIRWHSLSFMIYYYNYRIVKIIIIIKAITINLINKKNF